MSTLSKREEKIASILALPITTTVIAARRVKAATSQLGESVRAEMDDLSSVGEIPKLRFRVADRARSHMFNGDKISFYQYFREKVIVAVSRKNGHLREKFFTPDIAFSIDVAFDLDGAVAWIRQTGFKDAEIPRAIDVAPWDDYPEDRKSNVAATAEKAAPAAEPEAVQKRETADEESSYVTEALPSHRTRPFSGRILYMGEIEKEGRDDKPFKVYGIRLKAYSGFEKEFLGEHLGELTEEMKLKVGDQITLKLLERRVFTVKTGRRTETRSKNIYSITRS